MSDSIAAFFSAWGDPNPETRARSLRDCVGEDVVYADPRTPEPITDTAALNHYIGMYSQHSPGATAHVAALSTTGTSHRATVTFVMADGAGQHGHGRRRRPARSVFHRTRQNRTAGAPDRFRRSGRA